MENTPHLPEDFNGKYFYLDSFSLCTLPPSLLPGGFTVVAWGYQRKGYVSYLRLRWVIELGFPYVVKISYSLNIKGETE